MCIKKFSPRPLTRRRRWTGGLLYISESRLLWTAGRIYIYPSSVSMSGELIWMSIDFHVVGGLKFPVDCVDRDCHFHSMCSSHVE